MYKYSTGVEGVYRCLYGFKVSAVGLEGVSGTVLNIGALIITYTIVVVPYYDYSIMGPKPYSNY